MTELQLRNYEIERAFSFFKQLTENMAGQVSASTHYKVLGLRNSLLSKASQYAQTKPKLISEHVEKDEDGAPKTQQTQLGAGYVFTSPEDEEQFNAISTKEVTVSVDEGDLFDLDDLKQFEAGLLERQILMKFTQRFAEQPQPESNDEEE